MTHTNPAEIAQRIRVPGMPPERVRQEIIGEPPPQVAQAATPLRPGDHTDPARAMRALAVLKVTDLELAPTGVA